jgi:hypothetical protein
MSDRTHAALCLGEGKVSCTCGATDPAAERRRAAEVLQERDLLIDWQNTVAARMGDNFDGDEGQEWIIDRWLDLVEERIRVADPVWHRYLFLSGPDPRTDEEEVAGRA